MSTGSVTTLRCFDLDGCVVVSDEAIADGLRHALDLSGLPMPDAEGLRAAIGPPLLSTIGAMIAEAGHDPSHGEGAELLRTAVAAYRTSDADVGFDLTRVVDGMVGLLERLRADAGTTLVVVTAKPTAVAEPLLEHLGLRSAFDAIYGAPLGPDVEEKRVTLARALAQTDTDPAHAVMIGDRAHDVRAGRACRTRTVGVLWGAGDRAELSEAGADHIVQHPDELDALVSSDRASSPDSPSARRVDGLRPGGPADR
jgi:phosphoglycolate phosphatase